jgi:hypothetical protein
MPMTGWTHSEGVEAADPATPTAVLTLASASRRYVALEAAPVKWSAHVGVTGESAPGGAQASRESLDNAHHHDAGHAGTAPATQATLEQ